MKQVSGWIGYAKFGVKLATFFFYKGPKRCHMNAHISSQINSNAICDATIYRILNPHSASTTKKQKKMYLEMLPQ